jgi:hypothetical protein
MNILTQTGKDRQMETLILAFLFKWLRRSVDLHRKHWQDELWRPPYLFWF